MRLAVLPYIDVDAIFSSIYYRPSPHDTFSALDVELSAINIDLRFDDLRVTPTHQFRIGLRMEALGEVYERFKDSIHLFIFAQDPLLRQRRKLFSAPITDVPEIITLDKKQLCATGLRDRIPLEFCVLNAEALKGDIALPRHRASRLAEIRVNLRNASAGFSFPHRRATEQEFIDAGLPAKTAFHMQYDCDAKELIKKSDSPLEQMFCAWIHEDIWHAIQTDKVGTRKAFRDSMAAVSIAQLVIEGSVSALKAGDSIEPGSPCYQLLSFVAKKCDLAEDALAKKLEEPFGAALVQPFIQAAFGLTRNASRTDIDGDEEDV